MSLRVGDEVETSGFTCEVIGPGESTRAYAARVRRDARAIASARLGSAACGLKFAVVPCNGPGPALEAFSALRPDVMVASPRDIAMIRDRLPSGGRGSAVPPVELVSTPDSIEPVISAIRSALRAAQMAPSKAGLF